MKEVNINIEGYNVNGICVGCLNYNRRMFYHPNVKECFRLLGNIDVPDGLEVQVCWECMARVMSAIKFRKQMLKSYDFLISYSKEHTFLDSPNDFGPHATTNLERTDVECYGCVPETDEVEVNEVEVGVKEEEEIEDKYGFDVAIKEERFDDPYFQDLPAVDNEVTSDEDMQLSKLKEQETEKGKKKRKNEKKKERERDRISEKKTKKRPRIGLFVDLSSNSETELDPFENNKGDYGSDMNYEPQQIYEAGSSSSSEEIFSYIPHRLSFGDPDASSDSSKSDISNRSSDFEQDDRKISESIDNSPLFLTSPHDNPAPDQQRSPVPEEQPWTHTTDEIPEFDFDADSHGIQFDVNSQTSVEQIFDHVFPKELIECLVQCTNNYGTNLCNSNRPSTRYSRSRTFHHTTVAEMKKFLGLSLLHGHIRIPKLQKLFTHYDPLYYHPVFSFTMSSRRYEQILRCLFCSELGSKGSEKINKFSDMMTLNFRKIYKPDKELSLDESLVLFRGRIMFRHYIKKGKSNKARSGVKFYILATVDGYVLNIIMDNGKNENTRMTGAVGPKLERLVMRLMKPFLMKGHHLFMDNYYNSVSLSQKLLDFKTHTNGTLRVNRQNNPKEVVNRKLNKGEHVWVRKNNVYVSKWVDKQPVIMLTTREHPCMIETTNRHGKMVKKPIEVVAYNKYKSGVDRSDQMINYYSSPRKTLRWYKKVLFHLLDNAVWNSYYLYKKFVIKNPKYELSEYREELIKKLIGLKENCKGKDLVSDNKKHILDPGQGLKFSGHWPKRQPAPENSKKKYSFLMCKMCSKFKKRVETSYRCIGCPELPALCPECFQDYHQLLEQEGQESID